MTLRSLLTKGSHRLRAMVSWKRGRYMLAESLLTLAGQAGWTVVAAASTEAWDTARHGFAHLVGRDDAVQTALPNSDWTRP